MTDLSAIRLVDATDDQLALALRDAELPSLMPALAYLTGDHALVGDDIRPPTSGASVVLAAQGGLTLFQQDMARERALAALICFRDSGAIEASPPTGLADQQRLLAYMTGPVDDRYLPMLGFELGLPTDVDSPDWNLATLGAGRPFRVAVIGAGMSGLAVAYRLLQAGIDFEIFERNSDVGGVWMENRYPGCRLDTSNFCYSYSFRQRDDWPHQYSMGSEIRDYFKQASRSLGVREHIRFRTEVRSAIYDDSRAEWSVTTRTADGSQRTVQVHAVISAVGQLNHPSFPDIAGIDRFAGESFHSARWDESIDLTGRRVGVVGSGASAYQLVPSIADRVGTMTLFQRTPPWTVPTPNYHAELPDGLAWLFRNVPYYHRWFRFYQFWTSVEGRRDFATVDRDWPGTGPISANNDQLRQTLTKHLLAEYEGRPDLQERMIPRFPPYGKRMLRDNGAWARTLKQPNVSLVTDHIDQVTADGVLTVAGDRHELDVLVYCTGFRAYDFLAGIDVRGRGGIDLHAQWGSEPTAYLGITVPNFPNLFCLFGPNTNLVVNGSTVMFSECAVHYVMEALRLLLERGDRAMDLRAAVLDEYQAVVDDANRHMAWGVPGVDNWYKSPSGRVSQNWPLSTLEYWERSRKPAVEHYEFL
ncbi:MAG: hapE [Pseudonocardiales bacterium]|nr:hapE [Pseudonocardiales bacterium]